MANWLRSLRKRWWRAERVTWQLAATATSVFVEFTSRLISQPHGTGSAATKITAHLPPQALIINLDSRSDGRPDFYVQQVNRLKTTDVVVSVEFCSMNHFQHKVFGTDRYVVVGSYSWIVVESQLQSRLKRYFLHFSSFLTKECNRRFFFVFILRIVLRKMVRERC